MAVQLNIRSKDKSGRGAAINPHPRFDRERRESDVTQGLSACGDTKAAPRTRVTEEAPKSIITRNTSPDLGFDRSINPYRGCEHGCFYCFARPSHAYLGLSPGLDFETQLFAKPHAADLLRNALSRAGYEAKPMALGTNTDPYQPIEREREITRSILKVLAQTRHPVGIVTKSDLVTRDIDILAPMAKEGLAKVAISVTSLDAKLSRLMEPRAPTPQKRLAAIKRLSDAGIPVMALIAPIIPALNDHEIEDAVAAVATAGAKRVNYVMLRLPHELKDLSREWLERHFPDRARRVIAMVRDMRGGKDYDATWGRRQRGEGPYAQVIAARMSLAIKRQGLTIGSLPLNSDLFRPPKRDVASPRPKRQLDLFGA
ncbi:MAG: PA0069 family radical SAM protein [Pseudomonadota bacterium]